MSFSRVGGYDVLRPLGSGGMGEVLLARDPRLERHVAIKILRSDFAVDPLARKRFHREAKALAALRHPGVVTIFEIGEDMGLDFIVMEFLEGDNLRRHMARKDLGQGQIIDLGKQIASAIAGAHGAGVLHRDIKPENIMVLDDGTIRVVDFGLARSFDEVEPVKTPNPDAVVDLMGDTLDVAELGRASTESDELPLKKRPAPRLTAVTETILGTPAYMAPELFVGEAPSAASDVYSLGVLLYEMFAGQLPYPASDLAKLLDDRVHGDREAVPLSEGKVATLEMSDFVQSLLRKEPSERPHIDQCLRTLEELSGLSTEKVQPCPADMRVDTPSLSHEVDLGGAQRRRRRAQARRMGVAAALLVAGGAAGLLLMKGSGGEGTEAAATAPAYKSKSIGVAVAPFESNLGSYAHAEGRIGTSAATIISSLLDRADPIRPVSPQELGGHVELSTADEGSRLRAAHDSQAMFLVSGRLSEKGGTLRAEVKIRQLLDRSEEELPPMERPEAELDRLLLDVANAIAGAVAPGTTIESAATESQRSVDSLALYELALSDLYRNDWAPACVKLERIVAEQPNFFEAWYHLAVASAWAAQPDDKTQRAVARAMELASTERDRDLMRVLKLYSQRRFLQAAPLAREMASKYPRDPELAYVYAEVSYHNGHYREGVELFDQAIRLAPRSHLATTHPLQHAVALGDLDAWQHYNRLRKGETADSSKDTTPPPDLRFALGEYEALLAEEAALPKEKRGRTPRYLAVMNRDQELDALLEERNGTGSAELALRYARAREEGREETASQFFARGMESLRTSAERAGNHLRIREFFEVVIEAGHPEEIRELFSYWELEGPMKGSEQEAVYRAFAAPALGDASWIASDGFTSWRQAKRHEALRLELENKRTQAVAIWRELLADPSQWGDWLDRMALARNLKALGQQAELKLLCASMMRPTWFRPSFVMARLRCREWKALPTKRERSGAFAKAPQGHSP